ncbi:hypothetical protein, partial [Lysobacter sp. Root690]|uniref:hypothetical protein n=1 Tax=Lysobacter sp. Root690 TaxID=1736588 RepID=UPI001F25F685
MRDDDGDASDIRAPDCPPKEIAMSRRKGVPPTGFDRRPLAVALALSIGAVLCTSAQAQEAGKLWISNAIPAQPQLTEAGIQQEIKTFFSNFPGGAAAKLHVTGNVVFGNKAVYNYDFEPLP